MICFFGDGAVNQGTFHESLNMAGLWRLPLLFVCENNHYAIGTEIHRHSAVVEVYKRAAAYNIPAEKVDGMDVLKVYDAAHRALDRIHAAAGRSSSNATPTATAAIPWLIQEAIGRRWKSRLTRRGIRYQRRSERSNSATQRRRSWPKSDPTPSASLTAHMVEAGHLAEADVEDLKKEVQAIVEDAAQFALQSPQPTMEAAWAHMNCNRHHEMLI